MEKGIKEISELLDGVKLLAVSGKKIAKDGISAEDVAHVVTLFTNFNTIVEAYKGLGEASEEIKNLDQSEVIEIIGKLYEIVRDVEKA